MDRSRWQRETPASGRDERLKLHLAEIALGAAITCTQDPLMQCDLSSLPSGAGVFLYVLPLKKCSQGRVDLQCCISFRCRAQWISYTYTHEEKWSESPSVVSNSLQLHGLYSPWNSPGQNAGVGSLSPSPGDLPNSGIEPRSPASQADSLPYELSGKLIW